MSSLAILDFSDEPKLWRMALEQFPDAGVGHLYEWRNTIRQAYGMESKYLAVANGDNVNGLLPLVFVKSRFFPGALVSMPYLNDGGILARDTNSRLSLWAEAQKSMTAAGARSLELRQTRQIPLCISPCLEKISMELDLTGGADHVWTKKIHSNVRNKIRKSMRMGVEIVEGSEWLESFYRMHLIRMQELGSPAHSYEFFLSASRELGERLRVYVALRNGRPIGGKIVCYFRDTVYFLWASSPLRYLKYAAVNLLNWRAIQDSIDLGMCRCDFGRSSAGSSHYDFKAKWGASPVQLYWYKCSSDGGRFADPDHNTVKRELFSRVWRHLPLPLVGWIGPKLRAGLPQ